MNPMHRRTFATRSWGKKSTLTITGDKELIAMLQSLPRNIVKKVLRFANPKAMKSTIKDARRRAPKETGLLKKSIGAKTKTYARVGTVVTVVGPRLGWGKEVTVKTPSGKSRKKFRDPAKYAHLVEFGTQPHSLGKGSRLRKGIQNPGKFHPGSPPRPFMRPALDANEDNIIATMKQEIARGVIKYATVKGTR